MPIPFNTIVIPGTEVSAGIGAVLCLPVSSSAFGQE